MALVSPNGMPASIASFVFALTPKALMNRSASIRSPPAIMAVTFSSPRNSSTVFPVKMFMPFDSRWSCTIFAMSGSSICGSIWGNISTIVTLKPRSISATPVSSPINPAPMITADFAPFEIAASIRSPSSNPRRERRPCFSLPFMGGMNASAPVAITRLSYCRVSVAPSLATMATVFSFVLIAVTFVSFRRSSLSIWKYAGG